MPVLAVGLSHHQVASDDLTQFAACAEQASASLRASHGVSGLIMLSTITANTPYPLTGFYLLLVGIGMGNIFPVVTTAVQNAVPRQQLGTATAAGLMFRQVGGSLAVAIFGAIFASRMATQLGDLPQGVEIGPQMLHGLPPEMLDKVVSAVVSGLHPIFVIGAAAAVAGFLFALALREVPLTNRMVPKGE